MSSEPAIRVENLSKRYASYRSSGDALRSLLFGGNDRKTYFDALKPVSFTVAKSASLGIIGQNGSGKSTLLQLITGILKPTTGTVHVEGRVAALLELGAGFNPEFTGLENARLNARILGISGREFDALLPEIEAFAGIGDFINKPVKQYSSGMYVRLAFAIQACIEPDVLIVDEALAVGDIFFRLKCYERLERLRSRGCTVILVTHSMPDVLQFCDDALLLHKGEAIFHGSPAEAINRYYALGPGTIGSREDEDVHEDLAVNSATGLAPIAWPKAQSIDVSAREQTGDDKVRCKRIAITNSKGEPQTVFRQFEMLKLYAEFEVARDLETPVVGVVLRTDRGVVVYGLNSGQARSAAPRRIRERDVVRAAFEIDLSIGPGEYVLDVGFATWPARMIENAARVSMAELEAEAKRHCVLGGAVNFSVVPVGSLGFDAQPFYGVADLRGRVALSVGHQDGGGAGKIAEDLDADANPLPLSTSRAAN